MVLVTLRLLRYVLTMVLCMCFVFVFIYGVGECVNVCGVVCVVRCLFLVSGYCLWGVI